MARLVFEKTGNAVWISHLDLMRLFQRAFKRAGLPLKHTQGFNPRPSVSIALPLSVGVESFCELLDFEIEGELPPMEEIRDRLNNALISGVKVISVSHGGKKLRDLSLLACEIYLEYDNGVGEEAVSKIRKLFSSEALLVAKKSKNGPVEQNIIPMIKKLLVGQRDSNTICIEALICCQNPSMNPMQIAGAVSRYLPEVTADHSRCCRMEIYDSEIKVFR